MKLAQTPGSVADFITQQLALSPKSQRTIAAEIGYDNPNVITMFKQGSTKLPLNKVGLLAKSLDLDPLYLLRIVMSEYAAETWAVLEDIVGRAATVSNEEVEIIGVVRAAAMGVLPVVGAEENRAAITAVIQDCVGRDWARNKATVDRLDAIPRNQRKTT